MSNPVVFAASILKVGSRGTDVKEMQERLIHLGYLDGKADGIFGEMTKKAVINFQKDHQLTPDGIAGPKTLSLLEELSGRSNQDSLGSRGGSKESFSIPITGILKMGTKGNEVKILQARLNELGFNVGKADGIFGKATYLAVVAFQKANQLVADGIVGAKTLQRLFAYSTGDEAENQTPAPQESGSGSDTGSDKGSDADSGQEKPFERFYGVPNQLKGKTVILDPGHGGSDSGASRNGVLEKTINLDLALRLKRILEEAGANVVMTRVDDTYVSLFYRSAFVNSYILNHKHAELTKQITDLKNRKKVNELLIINRLKNKREKTTRIKAIFEDLNLAYDDNMTNRDRAFAILEGKKTVLSEMLEAKKADHQIKYTEYSQVANEYQLLQDQLNLLNTEMNLLLEEKDSLNKQILEMEQREQPDKDGIKALQIKLLAVQRQINEKKDLLDSKNAELSLKQGQLADAEREVKALKKDMQLHEKELSSVVSDIDLLSNFEISIKALDEEIETLEAKIDALSAEVSEKEKQLGDVNAAIEMFLPYIENPSLDKRLGIYEISKDLSGNKTASPALTAVFDLTGEEYQNDIIFLSIHVNSTSENTTKASGVQVYYRDNGPKGTWESYLYPNYYGNYNSADRRRFAEIILKNVNATTNFSKKETNLYMADLSVLRESNLVSALVEVGFINNPNDRQLLLKEQTREDVVAGLYKGIVEYFKEKEK